MFFSGKLNCCSGCTSGVCFHKSTKLNTSAINLVFLGTEKVGKTTIVRQFLSGNSSSEYISTTLETFVHFITVGKERYRLHLCDSSGSKEFSVHRAPYIARADGLLLVYSTTDRRSLRSLVDFVKDVFNLRSSGYVKVSIPILFLGTRREIVGQREVGLHDAERVAVECMSILGIKLLKHKKKDSRCSANSLGFLSLRASDTFPVIEINTASLIEVTHAVRSMIRMIECFRSVPRLPLFSMICLSLEADGFMSDTRNTDTDMYSTVDMVSNQRCLHLPSTIDGLKSLNHPLLDDVGGESAEMASYSPRSVGVTQSVHSSAGEEVADQGTHEESGLFEVFAPVQEPITQGRKNNDSVLEGNAAQASAGAVNAQQETRAVKVEFARRDCPQCALM